MNLVGRFSNENSIIESCLQDKCIHSLPAVGTMNYHKHNGLKTTIIYYFTALEVRTIKQVNGAMFLLEALENYLFSCLSGFWGVTYISWLATPSSIVKASLLSSLTSCLSTIKVLSSLQTHPDYPG